MTSAELDEKRHRAAELRMAGLKYEQIAEQLGYASASGAFHAVQKGLEASVRESSDDLVRLELGRLDALLTGLWPKARRGDVAAVDRVLKLMLLRERYLGLEVEEPAAEQAPDGEKKGSAVDDLRARRAARFGA